jgi:hypothetical protein
MNDDIVMGEDIPTDISPDRPKHFEVIVADEASCKAMMNFWVETKGAMDWNNCNDYELQIIPCDEPLKGLKGYFVSMSFHHVQDADVDDVSMWFFWRHEDPIKRIVDINFEDHNPSEVMIRCVDEGWISCNDPMSLRVGFLNYEKSECMQFGLSVVKGMSEEARLKFQQSSDN